MFKIQLKLPFKDSCIILTLLIISRLQIYKIENKKTLDDTKLMIIYSLQNLKKMAIINFIKIIYGKNDNLNSQRIQK